MSSSLLNDECLAGLLNRAFEPIRALPRVVPQPVEWPPFTAEGIAEARANGWFGENCFSLTRDGRLASFADMRFDGEGQAQLGLFATDPQHQHQRLASTCLTETIASAAAGCAGIIRTERFIDSRNTAACSF